MHHVAIAEMAAAEDGHWWYDGLRDLLGRLFASPRFAPPPGARVLDAGCGTGANLRYLQETLQPGYLAGFDAAPACLEAARRKCPEADLQLADFGDPPFNRTPFDLIVSCDVISYVEPSARLTGLRRLAACLSPAGRMVLHVPACPQLYGRHDRAVGTRERFTAAGLRRLVERAGLEVEFSTYRLCLLFPAVMAARLPFCDGGTASAAQADRSDLTYRSRIGAAVGRRLLAWENSAVSRGLRWPLGSSLLLTARRPATA